MAGLYVHIPFRRASQTYDDAFTTVSGAEAFPEYAAALERELIYYAQQHASDEPIETVYAGGGRPSLFSLANVRNVLQTVLNVFDGSTIREATAEVNPADATPSTLSALRSVGFDRLQFDVLSFFPDDLDAIQTPHTAQEAVRAIREARQAGFESLSVDLLFGWPGQPMKHWQANLEQAVDMNLPHVTLVEWTGDRSDFSGTPGADGTDAAAPAAGGEGGETAAAATTQREAEVRTAKQLQTAMEILTGEGYEQYELTHFAQTGHASEHQKNYYAHGNYLGVGASAHSFWWRQRMQSIPARRWANVRDVPRYQQLLSQQYPPISFRETVDWATLADEYITLRLRTREGLDLRRLRAEYGRNLQDEKASLLDTLVENGLAETDDRTYLRLTPRGLLVADGITERLTR